MLPTFEPLETPLSCSWLTGECDISPAPHRTVGLLISLCSALPKAGEGAQPHPRVATLKATVYVIYWVILNQIGFCFVRGKYFYY